MTPPGAGGLQPSLGLVYSSSAGNGAASNQQSNPAGFGWDLAGTVQIVQSLSFCDWTSPTVCPKNAYWGEDDFAHLGNLEFTLSINGTGYELIHSSGDPAQNGNAGRYIARGGASIYVELCRLIANPTTVCIAEDDTDVTPGNGAADS